MQTYSKSFGEAGNKKAIPFKKIAFLFSVTFSGWKKFVVPTRIELVSKV